MEVALVFRDVSHFRIPVDTRLFVIDNPGGPDRVCGHLFLVAVVLLLTVVPDTVFLHVLPAACFLYTRGHINSLPYVLFLGPVVSLDTQAIADLNHYVTEVP